MNKDNLIAIKFKSKYTKTNYNYYDLSGEYGIGYTDGGCEFYFDLEDYDLISKYRWHKANSKGYIAAHTPDKRNMMMHRLVMGIGNEDVDYNKLVDHINGVKYDNRKQNLRFCTNQQNMINQKVRITNKTGVRGVYYNKKHDTWNARIGANYKGVSKSFKTFEEAVKFRKQLEKEYYDEEFIFHG